MGRLWRRMRAWLGHRSVDAGLAEEMEFHRAMKERELRTAGFTAEEAAHGARRELGPVTRMREESRAVWIAPWIESVWQDLCYAARSMRRQPGFFLLAAGTLGLGIGLNTSLFTVFNAVALRPWPVRDPGRVVTLFNLPPVNRGMKGASGFPVAELRYFQERAKTLRGVVVMRNEAVQLGEDPGERSRIYYVSGNYFDVLGVGMELGRGFLPEEDSLDTPQPVAVLSYRMWRNRFGGDPQMIGKRIRLNEAPLTVVGVAAEEFTGTTPEVSDLWVPIGSMQLVRRNDNFAASFLRRPNECCSEMAARLAPGVSRAQASAELSVLHRQFGADAGWETRGVLVAGTAFFANPGVKGAVGTGFLLMFVAVTLVLVLACANVGNLLVARAAARRREIAVRLSLGAGRPRVIRQLLTESLALAGVAGGLGLAMARLLPEPILTAAAGPTGLRLEPDAMVLGYAIGISALACALFGLAPALQGTRMNVPQGLAQQASFMAARFSLRGLLLAVQVAISVVLLASAGLLIRGVQNARTQDPGFSIRDVAVVSFDLPAGAYGLPRTRSLVARMLDDLAELPGAQPFGIAAREPLNSGRSFRGFRLPGQSESQNRLVQVQTVSAGYFDVMRIPIVAGRNFAASDSGHVVLINETMARRFWPGESAVGKRFISGPEQEVIGVAKDAYTTDLDRVEPTYYELWAGGTAPKILVRTSNGALPGPEGTPVAAMIRRMEPRAVVHVTPLADSLERWLAGSRIAAEIAGGLGVLALALAAIGMFGVFAYAVQQRTREIGIRMAIGATPGQVIRLVVGGSSRAVAAGLAIGFAASAALSRLIAGQLYGVSRFDPAAYGAVGVLLAAAGLAASYVPARRATRVDPMAALRVD